MNQDIVTVQQMIDSLSKFPMDASVEIAITQYNKRYAVAYCSPQESHMVSGSYATMLDGRNVRITASLPYDKDKYMMVQERKIA